MSAAEPRLVAENVSKWFGALVAVSDVSFDIGPGVTALLGPNGAGKSTMLRMLCGLARPSRGTIRVLGRDPRSDVAVTRSIGLVPQQESVFESLTALRFVQLTATLHGLPDPDAAAAAALERVGLDPSDSRRLPAYSKGMRQRVKVAQGLVHDPLVLMLDEPLTGPRSAAAGGHDRAVSAPRRGGTVRARLEPRPRRGRAARLADPRHVAGPARGGRRFPRAARLMDDRPLRVRVRTNRPRELAGALLEAGTVVGARLDGDDARARHERREDAGPRAGSGGPGAGREPARGHSPRRRPRGRLPLPGAAMSAAATLPARRPRHGGLARCALPPRASHAGHGPAPARHRRARRAGRAARRRSRASGENPAAEAAADVAASYGLGIVVPLAALWLGTSAIGDLVEDRLLVYLWLKPVPRWQLPAAAVLATVTLVVPLTAAAARRLGARGGRRRARARRLARRVARGVRLRRPLRRGRAVVPPRGLVGPRVRAALGERRRVRLGRHGALHGHELGALDRLRAWTGSTFRSTAARSPRRSSSCPAIAVAGWLAATVRYRRADVD